MIYRGRMAGRTFGPMPEGQLHEVENKLKSEYGELCNVYMIELGLKL